MHGFMHFIRSYLSRSSVAFQITCVVVLDFTLEQHLTTFTCSSVWSSSCFLKVLPFNSPSWVNVHKCHRNAIKAQSFENRNAFTFLSKCCFNCLACNFCTEMLLWKITHWLAMFWHDPVDWSCSNTFGNQLHAAVAQLASLAQLHARTSPMTKQSEFHVIVFQL